MTTAGHHKDTLFAETLFVKALVAFVLVILAGLTIASLATTMVFPEGINVTECRQHFAIWYPVASLLVLLVGCALLFIFRGRIHRALSIFPLNKAYGIHVLWILLIGLAWIMLCEAPPEQTICTALTGQS